MGRDYIPTNDGELRQFAIQLARALTSAPANYGMTAGEATALTDAVNAYAAAMVNVANMQAAATAAVANKNALRDDLKATIRGRAAKIQATPGITGALLEAAGLPVHDDKPSRISPVPPSLLTCTPHANGFNTLTWNRNGNPPRTMFDIEAKRNGATDYTHVYTVTATKYEDPNPPGAPVMYRVRARRHKQVSEPSNTAGVS